jgi:subtilisin family serine protease
MESLMQYDKLSAGTMILMGDYASRGDQALAVRSRAFGVSGRATPDAEPAAVVFLRCDATHSLDDLHESIQVQSGGGAIRAARVPLSRMEEVANHPAVQRIQIARYLQPKLDQALPKIEVPQFRSRTDSNGSGVVIGIVDSGIDGTHPSFGGRILRVWDQSKTGPGVPEGPGMELRGDAIAAFSTDELGHGTHVAGIAAGALAPYTGVAPAATLVIVKTTFLDADVAAGVRYLFRVIDEMGARAAVVNLSLGGHLDAHDGTDELSEVIDAHSGPGRIVCCAAGNEGLAEIHAQATIGQGLVTAIQFEVPEGTPLSVLNGWYSRTDEIEVAIEDPAGRQTPFQGPIPVGDSLRQCPVDSGTAMITTPGLNPVNGDHHIHIQLVAAGAGGLRPGVWNLLLRGRTVREGAVDFWSADMTGGPGVPFRSHVNDQMKIGAPGCASAAVTVGCFASRRFYVSADGLTRTGPFDENILAPDTSPGPLRNGARKPDLVAPGAVVISAFAARSRLRSDGDEVTPIFKADHGSSMSTAMVSGLIALMLQKNPMLTPAEAKQRLAAASSMPGRPALTFDFQSGYGLIDAGKL